MATSRSKDSPQLTHIGIHFGVIDKLQTQVTGGQLIRQILEGAEGTAAKLRWHGAKLLNQPPNAPADILLDERC
jgi:hypothetical protein